MIKYYKYGNDYDYFVQYNGEYYYLQAKDLKLIKMNNNSIPNPLTEIRYEDIDNAKPDFDSNDETIPIDKNCYCFSGISKRRNKISEIEWTFVFHDITRLLDNHQFHTTKSVVKFNRTGEINIARFVYSDFPLTETIYIDFGKMAKLFKEINASIEDADLNDDIVDDHGGWLTAYYENYKEIKIKRGTFSKNGKEIHTCIYRFIKSLGIEPIDYGINEKR